MYNLSFVLLINLVLQAVVSGIIIDTFSEMRAENEAKEADMNTICFICSINRDDFEQAGISFSDHIREEHNMWKYLYFKLYLDLKDPLSFSGPENHAHEKMKDKQSFVRLFPIKKSLSLDRRIGTNEEEYTMAMMHKAIKNIQMTQEHLYKSVEKLKRICESSALSRQQPAAGSM